MWTRSFRTTAFGEEVLCESVSAISMSMFLFSTCTLSNMIHVKFISALHRHIPVFVSALMAHAIEYVLDIVFESVRRAIVHDSSGDTLEATA